MWKGRTIGWTLRANSSNTRCWYSISVTKRAAWNRREPFQPSGDTAVGQLPLRERLSATRRGVVGQRGLDVVDQAVVLVVEDLVDRRQGDVLVAATVTTGEVVVEHLVVVGTGRLMGEICGGRQVGVRRRSRPAARRL